MNRRGFLAALVALPLAWRLTPKAVPVDVVTVNVGGGSGGDVFMFERGLLVTMGGPQMVVTAVDYEKGTVTMQAFKGHGSAMLHGSPDGKGWQYQ